MILETKLQFYILLMSVRNSDRASIADENGLIGASSSAAAVFKRRFNDQLFSTCCRRWAWSLIGNRRSCRCSAF